jgi:hypothetical protein
VILFLYTAHFKIFFQSSNPNINDRHKLTWQTTGLPLADLPAGITRHYIPTLHGKLEILSAQPFSSQRARKLSSSNMEALVAPPSSFNS